MDRTHLNEHDANQGAQSKGEFLGMTGNSGWYLLGSAGASIMIVILFWGVLGVSLLLCLFLGVVLCGLSVTYVFALKNNKPAHYDTDFLESALIEARVLELAFGPRARRPANPFAADAEHETETRSVRARRGPTAVNGCRRSVPISVATAQPSAAVRSANPKPKAAPEEPVVTLAAYETLREDLDATEELLEDALAERGEI